MIHTIVTYGGGEFLTKIFNALASLFNGGGLNMALSSAALIGFLGMMISSAFSKNKLSPTWILTISVIFTSSVVTTTKIHIEDKINAGNSSLVDNVPIGIALPASLMSRFSDILVKKFETVFSIPNNLKYRGNGMLFAQTLIEESSRFEIKNTINSANLSEFWRTCIFFDLALGLYSWDKLVKSGNTMQFFKENTSVSRHFSYKKNNSTELINCREGFNNQLSVDIENEVKKLTKQYATSYYMETYDPNLAVERFAKALQVGYQFLANISTSASEVISQNILANSLKRGLSSFAGRADASAAIQDYALAKAEAARNASSKTASKISKKMMPILQHIIEAFIYALFPIVMIMLMFPIAGMVIKTYLKVIAWINLWPIMYAVLNYAMTFYSQKSVEAYIKFSDYSGNLNMINSAKINNILQDYSITAGIVALSIPLISWMIVNSSGHMMGNFAGRVLEGFEGPALRSAEEASAGNISMGQSSYQNKTAFQNNTAPLIREGYAQATGSDGIQKTLTSGGNFTNSPQSSGPIDINFSDITSAHLRNNFSTSQSNLKSAGSDYSESLQEMNSDKNSVVKNFQESGNYSKSFSERSSKMASLSNENSEKWAENFARQNSWNESKAITMMHGIQGEAGVGISNGLLKAGAKYMASLGGSYSSTDQEMGQKMLQAMNSESFSNAVKADAAAVRNYAANFGEGYSQQKLKDLSDSINENESASLRYSRARSESHAASKQLENATAYSSAISEKGLSSFLSWANNSKGISSGEMNQLLSHSNQNNFYAKRELNGLAKEYVQDNISRNAEDINGIKNINIEDQYETNRSKVSHERKNLWSDEDYDQAMIKIQNKSSTIESSYNNPSSLSEQLDLNGLNLDKEKFDTKIEKLKDSIDSKKGGKI